MKKNIIIENVCQLEPQQIFWDIIPERTVDFFKVKSVPIEIKDGILIATIDAINSDLNLRIDMKDVANYYGYKKWKLINVVNVDYSDEGCILINEKNYVTKVQFSERIKR